MCFFNVLWFSVFSLSWFSSMEPHGAPPPASRAVESLHQDIQWTRTWGKLRKNFEKHLGKGLGSVQATQATSKQENFEHLICLSAS